MQKQYSSFEKESRMKSKKTYIVVVILGLGLICSSICCYFINKNQSNASADVQLKGLELKGLELTRSRLYLIKGKQYNLDFQPDQYKNLILYPDQRELQDVLRDNIKWSSSDKAVVVDQDGIVTAICPGNAVISADLADRTYRCEVHVLSNDTDEIPISYHNKLFSEKLFHKIEKMEVRSPSTKEIQDPFLISSIYSYLAALDLELDEVVTSPDSIRMGGSTLILHLKGGEKMGVILGGGLNIGYDKKYYDGSYGKESGYGNGVDLAWEIEKLLFQQGKK